MDALTKSVAQEFLLQVYDKVRKTVFFITHDLEEAVYLGTRLIVLSQNWDDGTGKPHGSKIVHDRALPAKALSTKVKETAKFGKIIQEVRNTGFKEGERLNIDKFNLSHPDSFMTIDEE